MAIIILVVSLKAKLDCLGIVILLRFLRMLPNVQNNNINLELLKNMEGNGKILNMLQIHKNHPFEYLLFLLFITYFNSN